MVWAVRGEGSGGQNLSSICFTTNGGINWSSVVPNLNSSITGISFANAQSGWAVGSAGTILFSSNGGNNWVQQSSPTARLLAKVWFINAQTGWACEDGRTAQPILF